MNATKILWGQILAVSAVALGLLWGATQWVAWRLAFQSQLGHPWFNILGWPASLVLVVVAIAMSMWRAREVKKVTTYGSAHWAETPEVRQAGLLGHDGVMLGRWRHDYLRHDGPEHVFCFAPTSRAKASASLFRRCSPGRKAPSFMTSRERTGP
jgi:type IV secretion system protein VirD4